MQSAILGSLTEPGQTIVERHVECEHCGSSDAYCLYEDGHGHCYSCGAHDFPNRKSDVKYTYEYLPYRGLAKETLQFYDIKTKVDPNGKPISVGFKMPNGDYKVRVLDKKDFYWIKNTNTKRKPGLFGRDKFVRGSHRYVTITEGYEDAASLYQVLHSPVVSVHSASSAVADCTVDHSWLNSYERVYLAFDNDAPGRDATSAVARLFDYNKVFVVRLDPAKDANELLQYPDGDVALKRCWWNSRKYLPENIYSSTEDFKRILSEAPKWGVPYPFPTLTEMTYGIRLGESVLITAQEGVGKTELMHAIEYQLLKETDHDVKVGAIFLEEPKQRHLQALAGIHLRKPVHLPDTDVTVAETAEAIEALLGVDERLFLYSHFGSDDAGILLDTIRFLVSGCGCRYILLDHITMAVSGLSGDDERRALDNLSTRLEMLVKELNFSLIIVSHINDEGKTRGSRYISKIADLRIDATRDLLSSDPIVRNTTLLSVSKNRYSGKTGPAGKLLFDPVTYTYQEVGDVITSDEKELQEVNPQEVSLVPKGNETYSSDKRLERELLTQTLTSIAETQAGDFERKAEERSLFYRASPGASVQEQGEGEKESTTFGVASA